MLISPFGNQLVLTEIVKDHRNFGEENFALQDDQGRFLDIVPSQRWSGLENKTMKITNSYEFLNGSTKMKTLTLIPLASRLKENYLLFNLNLSQVIICLLAELYGKKGQLQFYSMVLTHYSFTIIKLAESSIDLIQLTT